MRCRRGFALILTLAVTALLVALAVEFSGEVYVELAAHRGYIDGQQAGIVAESGIPWAARYLQSTVPGQEYTSLQDLWANLPALTDERNSLQVTIEEENGKLDLNLIVDDFGKPREPYHSIAQRLLARLGIATQVCDTIADWVDADEIVERAGGAESAWYQGLKPPYRSKNSRLESLEELLLVRGIDRDVFAKLAPYVTVHVAESNPTAAAMININTAPVDLLAALHPDLTRDLAQSIAAHRRDTPFETTADLFRVAGMGTLATDLQTKVTVRGNVYRLIAKARTGEATRVVEGVFSLPRAQTVYWREY